MDINRLNRDYREQPLGLREHLTYDEIHYLYIELNWCNKKINTFLGKRPNSSWAIREAERHGIVKTKEQQKQSMEQYYLETIGVKNPALKPGSMDKMKQTMKEKYGVENIAHRPETIDKRKKTCIEKYGQDNPAKVQEFKDKAEQTSLKKFGVKHASQNKLIQQKQKDTMMERYGVEHPYQSKEIMDKYKQTSLERYGVDNIMRIPLGKNNHKKSMLHIYGVENSMLSDDLKGRFKQSIVDKYGVDNPLKCPEIHEKQKQTMMERYGVENASQLQEFQQKKYDTMTKNDTWWGKSKPEQEIFELLKLKYPNTQTQYNKDERYPFLCDFYIPDLDLFIEYQGFISHGFHPFNPLSSNDLDKLIQWWYGAYKLSEQGKSDRDNSYLGYIHTWTLSDPYKRYVAKENNLNYLEFFNKEQFMDWYDSI